MRVNITKLSTGGGFPTSAFLVDTMPTPTTPVAEAPKNGTSLLDEDTFKILLDKGGLKSDVNSLVDELIKLEAGNTNPFLASTNRNMALTMIKKVNELRENKSMWEDAVKHSKEAGGLSEVAVGTSGEVYAIDKDNKINAISLDEYNKKRNSVKLLTVSELLRARQQRDIYANDNRFIDVANNAIGIKKITDHVKDLVNALGKEETSSTEFYSKDQIKQYLGSIGAKTPTAAEQEAIATLKGILATPGEYAQVEKSSSTQRNHIDKALKYIWNTLGDPARQKLTATAAISGDDPKNIILNMLETQTDHSETSQITPKELPGQTAADKNAKNISLSPQELFHNDRLYSPGMSYEINNPKAGVSLKATATGIGPLFSLIKEGGVIGPKTISSVMVGDNYKSIIDPAKAYIGDTKIDPMMMKELAFTGEEVAKVYIPVRNDGSPDLAQMETFSKAYQVFDMNKDTWTVEQIQDFFKKSGFNDIQIKEQQGSDGKIMKVIGENGKVKPFLALPVITNSASDISDNAWMVEMQGDQKDAAEFLMNEAFSVAGGTPSKPRTINTMPTGYFSLETPYKGVMFVAYRPEASAIVTSMQGHLTGKAPTETDLYRNLNYSTAWNNPVGLQSSAKLLQ